MFIGGETEDHKLNVPWSASFRMVKNNKVPMDPTANNISNLCEIIIQAWNAESVVNEMVLSSDKCIANTGRWSKIKGTDNCFLDLAMSKVG